MTQNIPDELLTIAEKPSRYIGTEVNSICRAKPMSAFCLPFPIPMKWACRIWGCKFSTPF